jgi:hypothetical protein
MGIVVKPLPAPVVPGNTDAERFDNAVRKIFTVSKADVMKEEAKWKLAHAKKQARKTAVTSTSGKKSRKG